MKTKCHSSFILHPSSFVLITVFALFTTAPRAPAASPTAKASEPIPLDQLGAVAGKQYQGDGLSVAATPGGAQLHCVFQRLEGQVTPEGLWLTSTAEGPTGERFRVLAVEVGRAVPYAPIGVHEGKGKTGAHGVTRPTAPLPRTGKVEVAEGLARFLRPGLVEEYSVSMDGVRQDFVVGEKPGGQGALRVELEVSGAQAEQLVNGARLVLEGSGRKLAYSRLRAVDAAGRELAARLEVTAPRQLAVVVDDAAATYPVRIDPTFSDADWFSLGSIPGADDYVLAIAVDGAGNLYIGGGFTVVGDVVANHIAKWNGTTWAALGSGMDGDVHALAVSGTDLYVGGAFTTAGGIGATNIAMWNGSAWSPLGPGLNGTVHALTMDYDLLYAGGAFTATADGITWANHVAIWGAGSWYDQGYNLDGDVHALVVSGSTLYAGGDFSYGVVRLSEGRVWYPLGGGFDGSVWALAVSGTYLYAGGHFQSAGGLPASNIARWDGISWSALGSGTSPSTSVIFRPD